MNKSEVIDVDAFVPEVEIVPRPGRRRAANTHVKKEPIKREIWKETLIITDANDSDDVQVVSPPRRPSKTAIDSSSKRAAQCSNGPVTFSATSSSLPPCTTVPRKRLPSLELESGHSKRTAQSRSMRVTDKRTVAFPPLSVSARSGRKRKQTVSNHGDIARTKRGRSEENDEDSQAIDSEDDYIQHHSGYEIHNESNWNSCCQPHKGSDDNKTLLSFMDKLCIHADNTDKQGQKIDPDIRCVVSEMLHQEPVQAPRSKIPRLWNPSAFHYSSHIQIPEVPAAVHSRNARQNICNYAQGSLYTSLNLHMLKLVSRFKQTSGCITKIVQAPGITAVACATSGGGPELPNDLVDTTDAYPAEPDPYNRDGNLQVWYGDSVHQLKAHDIRWTIQRPQAAGHVYEGLTSQSNHVHEYHKAYTVNDVAFDPLNPQVMVSSGNDCVVRVWEACKKSDGNIEFQEPMQLSYRNVPNDLAFKPSSSVLAVANFDGCVHIHPRLSGNERYTLKVASDLQSQKTGAFAWGKGNMLYASSETDNDEQSGCQHLAFDVERRSKVFTFCTTESGDALTLDFALERLALVTSGEFVHTVRLFDVARHDGRRPIHEETLMSPTRQDLEVNCATFSPDGILLALARNDHVTHVYDTRFMNQVIHTFEHSYEYRGVEQHQNYGITSAKWVEGLGQSGLGLVTAGSDGCVRLWDLGCTSNNNRNGIVIAQVDHDIASISMGDPFKGEHRLVIGDCGGGISIYD